MTLDEIRAELQNADGLPARALTAAVTQAAALAPEIIALIDKATRGVFLMPKEENLLFFGLHAVAAARETSVYPPLVALLRLPEEDIDRLLGDSATATAVGMLLALYDGDADPLFAAAEDVGADGSMRWGVLQVLARLTWEGRVPRDRMVDLLDRFEREEMAEPGDLCWIGWQDAIMYLGLDEFEPRVRRCWEAGRMPAQKEVDEREWLRLLRRAVENPDDPQRFIDDHVTPLGDPVAALSWLADPRLTSTQEGARSEPDDPAKDIRLTVSELDWLDGFLASGQVPVTAMSMEMLDGFFVALVAGPGIVPPSEYMPSIWGATEDMDGPVFDSAEQAQFVVDLLLRHWNTIAMRLDAGFPHEPFLYPGGEARAWATGFVTGLDLRQDTWLAIMQDEEAAVPVMSILGLVADEYDPEAEPVAPELRAQVIQLLPVAILAIRHFWRHGAPMPLRQEPVRVAKVGRNEPCPCGSGRKYKKCCGAAA